MIVEGPLMIIDEKKRKKIRVCDIIYCEGDINYTIIYLENGKKITSARGLNIFENALSGFVRIHRKYLINPYFVDSQDAEILTVTMRKNIVLKISRRRKSQIFS
jgi:two-component system LytT family response regulator